MTEEEEKEGMLEEKDIKGKKGDDEDGENRE